MAVPRRTVRDAALDVLLRYGMSTIFGNPGSTEVPFLASLPPDVSFVLGLHESVAVGMATGWSLGSGVPPLVLLQRGLLSGDMPGAVSPAGPGRR